MGELLVNTNVMDTPKRHCDGDKPAWMKKAEGWAQAPDLCTGCPYIISCTVTETAKVLWETSHGFSEEAETALAIGQLLWNHMISEKH